MTPTTGSRFGRLRVLERAESRNGVRMLCECECGATCTPRAADLRSGKTTSCGCLGREHRVAGMEARRERLAAERSTHIPLSARKKARSEAVAVLYAFARGST